MKYYPVFLDLKGKSCLVAGGGRVAERKTRSLLAAGAEVVCVSEKFTPGILQLARKKKILLRKEILSPRSFSGGRLKGFFLVFGATSSSAVNAGIFKACRKKNILVNAADDVEHCNFIAPAILSRGLLTIAVSTGGASPTLAKRIKARLEELFGPEYALFLSFMARERKSILARVATPGKRKKIFAEMTAPEILGLFARKNTAAVNKGYHSILRKYGVKGPKS